ncbi:MAG TPA: alpha/beta fold hydrolase, partial [Terracidiphilus sp.]|nr:alpha/beta fold hydrolase [Terracidiphilus sp.]
KVLNAPEWGFGWPVLRFNFRGTGLSEGSHDGSAETEDVTAALKWLDAQFGRPIVAVGFSFGAAMTLLACCGSMGHSASPAIRALALLGLPTRAEGRQYQYPLVASCSLPKLFLSGDADQYASEADLREVLSQSAQPRKLMLVRGADHFFTGQLEEMQSALSRWLKEELP